MINQDRPQSTSTPSLLAIGGGYLLLIGDTYSLIISPAGTGMVNESKVSIGQTWGTIDTTWATETGTWLSVSQLIGNTSKPSTSITNFNRP